MPLNIDFQQILLHLFNFILLGGGMYLLLYKPVKSFMDKRTEHFAELEKNANGKLAEAEALKSQYEGELAIANAEIAEDKAKATADIRKQCDAELIQARDNADKIIEKARSEAEKEKARIIAEAQVEIVKMAEDAAQKILLDSVSDAYDQFLEGAEGSDIK